MGLLMLATLGAGVVVGALAFNDSPALDTRSSSESKWTTGSATETTLLLGPTLVQDVYLGLSCPVPNSIECDRVTIAVNTDGPAREMRVWVAGRRVEMAPPGENGRSYWEGSLQPAGLLEGPLERQAREGELRWVGKPTVAAEVKIEIETTNRDSRVGAADPTFSATYHNVVLHAGYG